MPISSGFFLVFSALIALLGLFSATVAEGYLYAFSLGMIVFGLLFGYGVIKRHFDMQDAKSH